MAHSAVQVRLQALARQRLQAVAQRARARGHVRLGVLQQLGQEGQRLRAAPRTALETGARQPRRRGSVRWAQLEGGARALRGSHELPDRCSCAAGTPPRGTDAQG